MDYVDWCGRVLSELILLWESSPQARQIGVRDHDLLEALSPKYPGVDDLLGEVRTALNDLRALSLVQDSHGMLWKVTWQGSMYAESPDVFWYSICNQVLRSDQEEVLILVNRLSQRENHELQTLHMIDHDVVGPALPAGFDPRMLNPIADELSSSGFIYFQGFLGGTYRTAAKLKGLIWQTRRDRVFMSGLIEGLVEEWETANVDFKRQLNTRTKSEKAEFIKDILGLATTQVSGKRWMIIGFDNRTRGYVGPPDPRITQDHLEQLLSQYTEPMVQIRYRIVDYRDGVGMIEVGRNSADIPYRVRSSVGEKKRIERGQIFVRHGSQTEEPTPNELESLLDEGERARTKDFAAEGERQVL